VYRARQLHQLRAAKTPDGMLPINLKARKRFADSIGTNAKVGDGVLQRLAHRFVRGDMLTKRQGMKKVLKVCLDAADRAGRIHRNPQSLVGIYSTKV